MDKEKQREQALKCIVTLRETFDLSNRMEELFRKEDVLFGTMIPFLEIPQDGSIALLLDVAQKIWKFESQYGAMPYYAYLLGEYVYVCYVDANYENWENQSPKAGTNQVWVARLHTRKKRSPVEFGYFRVKGMNGTLVHDKS